MTDVLNIKDWIDALEGAQFRVTGGDQETTCVVERIRDGVQFVWDDDVICKNKKEKIFFFDGDMIHVWFHIGTGEVESDWVEINDITKI